MGIVRDIIGGLDRRKVKMFSIFLACSFLIWFISKLSEPYESGTTFALEYINLPDSLLISKGPEAELDAKVSANGFQFLYYNFSSKKIRLDLTNARALGDRFYLPKTYYERAISRQLSSSVKLVDIEKDTLFLNVFRVESKKVPIQANITLDLQQNYLVDGPLVIEPDSIILKGPSEEIKSIQEIITEKVEVLEVADDFSVETKLSFPDDMVNTVASSNSVKISGKAVRFSEKVFQIDVGVLNVPEEYSIKTFPKSVSLLCKASMEYLKSIEESDFQVIANYENHVDDKMFLTIKVSPRNVYDVRLLENQVNFILEKR